MLNKQECLKIIAKHRTDEIVITTMGSVVPWGKISDHTLDFASVGSAMGHAADFALGIALARPDKKSVGT
jgi:pyruvate/2-oxoacid:ferredoxin oxidoreductase beta subunit